jgi:hypothetical protein
MREAAELVVQINGVPLAPSFFAPYATRVWELYSASF